MRSMAAMAADTCDALPAIQDSSKEETTLYEGAVNVVVAALHTGQPGTPPKEVAERALALVVEQSAAINRAWPADARFHAEVTSLPGLLVLSLSFRSSARWFAVAFGKAYGDTAPAWHNFGQDQMAFSHPAPRTGITIYPLRSGSSGRSRFLARAFYTGCAGSSGLAYEVQEWDPRYGNLETVLTQDGALGMDPQPGPVTRKNPFPTIGTLRTTGRKIVLPYCYFSPIDTWDNPDLCVADSYDLSGAEPVFVSRVSNRPDMLALSSALRYAAAHDLQALEGYCLTPALAARLLRGVPSLDITADVKRRGAGLETVDTGAGRFTLRRLGGRWVVAGWKSVP